MPKKCRVGKFGPLSSISVNSLEPHVVELLEVLWHKLTLGIFS